MIDLYIGRRMLRMELPGKRTPGRRRFMDVVKEGMAVVEVTEADTEERSNYIEMENPLWRPLVGISRKKKKKKIWRERCLQAGTLLAGENAAHWRERCWLAGTRLCWA